MIVKTLGFLVSTSMALSSGIIVSVAFLSLILSIGLLDNLIEKFDIYKYKKLLVYAISIGVIMGSCLSFYPNQSLMLNKYWVGKSICIVIGLFYGIFVGYLSISLTEVFDVIPIINNKVGFRFNIKLFIIAVAVGKLIGSITYFLIPGFYSY